MSSIEPLVFESRCRFGALSGDSPSAARPVRHLAQSERMSGLSEQHGFYALVNELRENRKHRPGGVVIRDLQGVVYPREVLQAVEHGPDCRPDLLGRGTWHR